MCYEWRGKRVVSVLLISVMVLMAVFVPYVEGYAFAPIFAVGVLSEGVPLIASLLMALGVQCDNVDREFLSYSIFNMFDDEHRQDMANSVDFGDLNFAQVEFAKFVLYMNLVADSINAMTNLKSKRPITISDIDYINYDCFTGFGNYTDLLKMKSNNCDPTGTLWKCIDSYLKEKKMPVMMAFSDLPLIIHQNSKTAFTIMFLSKDTKIINQGNGFMFFTDSVRYKVDTANGTFGIDKSKVYDNRNNMIFSTFTILPSMLERFGVRTGRAIPLSDYINKPLNSPCTVTDMGVDDVSKKTLYVPKDIKALNNARGADVYSDDYVKRYTPVNVPSKPQYVPSGSDAVGGVSSSSTFFPSTDTPITPPIDLPVTPPVNPSTDIPTDTPTNPSTSIPTDTPSNPSTSVPTDTPSNPSTDIPANPATDVPANPAVDNPADTTGKLDAKEGSWVFKIPILGDILKVLQKILEFLGNLLTTLIKAITDAISTVVDKLQEFLDIKDFSLDFSPLKIALKDKFPFCIPFDFIKLFSVFSASPTDFQFTIKVDTQYWNINHTVDLSPFRTPILFFRYVVVVWFCFILMNKTRDFIKW